MATCGHKKEDFEHPSIIDTPGNKAARPAKPWNPFGALPAPSGGGGGEEEDEKIAVFSRQWLRQDRLLEEAQLCLRTRTLA